MSPAKLVSDGFLTVAQTAAYLALSKSSVYDLIRAGMLSHGRFAGKLVVPKIAAHQYAQERVVLGSVA